MTKIKIFHSAYVEELEQKINDFLETQSSGYKEILQSESSSGLTITIIY